MARTDAEIIRDWREENRDDPSNHPFPGDPFAPGDCPECGDNAAGLLHAFDPQFPEGYFDDVIVDLAYDLGDDDDDYA